ncbi:uncharacterized protein TRIADDRAFT_61025 [Trichoplax adhaerens]|uniref:G-protein coupled receptors family 1 profile domain-containing protein n=1 Tax=Trichoplax adhaerens TaxID=10228 RepID=B3S9T9_TRIAD|nr:hypothetical protein TRIADDRAFT_61025 [Trichoplax adhaerens]EDV20596.1 hypothetical protein TRIADDRAFT_61025 [Trichoplax adhaerens]|eukprot:XP_002117022.1 hypothetical protein TRIADDRAFT_61025 [Trichoplax adhaerens]
MVTTCNNTLNATPTIAATIPPAIVEKLITYSIISALTITTNGLLILLIALHRSLHHVSNAMIASMAVAAICYSLTYLMPRWALYEILNLRRNAAACTLLPMNGILFILILNSHICLVSFDRYVSVTHPFSYNRRATPRLAAIFIAIVWFLPILAIFIPLVSFLKFSSHRCVQLRPTDVVEHRVYLILLFTVLFFIPLIVLVFVYGRILIIVNDHTRRQQYFQNGPSSTPTHAIIRNIKALRSMAIIVGVFILFWMPYVITFLSLYLSTRITHLQATVVRISQYFAFSYPAVCPLIYVFFTADLRSHVLKYFRFGDIKREHCITLDSTLRRYSDLNLNMSVTINKKSIK